MCALGNTSHIVTNNFGDVGLRLGAKMTMLLRADFRDTSEAQFMRRPEEGEGPNYQNFSKSSLFRVHSCTYSKLWGCSSRHFLS